MRFIALMLLASACHASNFTECNMAGVSESATKNRPALFVNHNNNHPSQVDIPQGQWVTLDVSDIVPLDARCIHITGQLMITHGTSRQTCTSYIGFRRYGVQYIHARGAEAVETDSGVRTNYGRWVPLETVGTQKLFQVRVDIFNKGSFPDVVYDGGLRYPNWCSFGFNGWIDAWGR